MRSMLICASLALPFQMRQRKRSTSVMIIAFAAPRAGSSSDSTPATCFRCCSRMARWNQSSIGGAVTPASARMRRSPGQPSVKGPSRDWGCDGGRVFRARFLTEGGYVAWVLRLVEIGAEGEGSCADVVEISRPDGLVDIADLGLTLAEAKLVLAGVQREIVAAQARDHAVRRPGCRRCEGVCRVKDYRQHAIATLFGQVAVRLPRFRCAGCGTTGTGVEWPPYARSTPE